MPILRLFAQAREAAGTGRAEIDGTTVDAVLVAAAERFGPAFRDVLGASQVWVNGEPAPSGQSLAPTDEVAVLPPVSGGG